MRAARNTHASLANFFRPEPKDVHSGWRSRSVMLSQPDRKPDQAEKRLRDGGHRSQKVCWNRGTHGNVRNRESDLNCAIGSAGGPEADHRRNPGTVPGLTAPVTDGHYNDAVKIAEDVIGWASSLVPRTVGLLPAFWSTAIESSSSEPHALAAANCRARRRRR
jgi:hypothetical protein